MGNWRQHAQDSTCSTDECRSDLRGNGAFCVLRPAFLLRPVSYPGLPARSRWKASALYKRHRKNLPVRKPAVSLPPASQSLKWAWRRRRAYAFLDLRHELHGLVAEARAAPAEAAVARDLRKHRSTSMPRLVASS